MDMSVYMDNGATTRVDQRVIDEMLPFFSYIYGNASSLHAYGQDAREAMERARARISSYLGAMPDELTFTSSGTEANNLAIKGVAYANKDKGRHIVVSAIEHDCVLNSCHWLEKQGFTVTYIPVDRYGLVDPCQVDAAIRDDTTLVSVMHANNEIGTIEPIREIGKICSENGVFFHTDACQTFGKLTLDVKKDHIDLATINAHKIYGPKGVGALYVRDGVQIEPWEHGGGQERGLRSSTENLPGIMGFAKAAELCFQEIDAEAARLGQLRDCIVDSALGSIEGAYLNGHRTLRLPNNANLGFSGFENDAIRLLMSLDRAGFAVSTGSACSSNGNGSSHVLAAIGLNQLQARGALRITLGRNNTDDEVERFNKELPEAVRSLRPIACLANGVL
jgi:cysteine desulfurase